MDCCFARPAPSCLGSFLLFPHLVLPPGPGLGALSAVLSCLTWWAWLVHIPSCMPAHQTGPRRQKKPPTIHTPVASRFLYIRDQWTDLVDLVDLGETKLWRRFLSSQNPFAAFVSSDRKPFPPSHVWKPRPVNSFNSGNNKVSATTALGALGALSTTLSSRGLAGPRLEPSHPTLAPRLHQLAYAACDQLRSSSLFNRLPTHHSNRLGAHPAQSTSTELLRLSPRVEPKSQIRTAYQSWSCILRLYQQH